MKYRKTDKRLILPGDEFEEEASEGLGKLNREEAQEDLRELRSRLERRLKKRWMIWLTAAAAVVIILIASAVYISLFRGNRIPVIRMARSEEVIRDTVLIAMAEPIVRMDTIFIAMAEPIIKTGVLEVRSEVMTRSGVSTREIFAIAEADHKTPEKKAEAVREKVTEEPANDAAAVAVPTRTILIGEEQAKDVAHAKVVPGVGTSAGLPSPVGGMDKFNLWIEKNIKYPADVEPGVRQEVVVTFKVAADSTIYGLMAEHTPGDNFTQEAFRLLRQGPKWIPIMRNGVVVEEKVSVSIVFK
jgi:hypothetical protein